jgi:formate dehydrogenase iron-sulfur subunit
MVEITPGQAYGFFTDTSVCIGCKACEVACKSWNQLDGNPPVFGDGYDNTGSLDAQNWRHVQFIDNVPDEPLTAGQGKAWLMMSGRLQALHPRQLPGGLPDRAIIRTEFDTVYIQPDVCNGCRDCISACPYGVIEMNKDKGRRPEVHAVLRPAAGRAGTGLRQGLPDPVHQLRARHHAARDGARTRLDVLHARASPRRSCTGPTSPVYGGPQRVLPAHGQARNVRSPQRGERRAAPAQQPRWLPSRWR